MALTQGHIGVGQLLAFSAAGRAAAGAITTTGTRVGDKIVQVMDLTTPASNISSSFETVVSVQDQIQQTGTTLSAHVMTFLISRPSG